MTSFNKTDIKRGYTAILCPILGPYCVPYWDHIVSHTGTLTHPGPANELEHFCDLLTLYCRDLMITLKWTNT